MAESPQPRLRGAIVPVTPFQQNCAILWDDETKVGMVVDPGGDVDRILEGISQTGARIERIILTHGHLDHAGGATGLQEAIQKQSSIRVPIEGPDIRDKFLLDGIEAQAAGYGFEARNVTPDRWMVEGETLIASTSCTALATRQATWCLSTMPRASPSLATCFFRGRWVGRIFCMVTITH